jgi:transcriptional regulator with XRE-family HTH domain
MQQEGAVSIDSEDFGKAFGDKLRKEREERHWSQRRLAEEIARYGVKLDASAITRIERGARDVKLREANAFARSMHLLLDDLVDSPEHDPYERFMRTHSAAMDSARKARTHLAEMAQYLWRAAQLIDLYPEIVVDIAEIGDGNGPAAKKFLREHAHDFPEVEPEAVLDVDAATRDLLNRIAVAAAQGIIEREAEYDPETQSTRSC